MGAGNWLATIANLVFYAFLYRYKLKLNKLDRQLHSYINDAMDMYDKSKSFRDETQVMLTQQQEVLRKLYRKED